MKQKKESKMKLTIMTVVLSLGLIAQAHASVRVYDTAGTELGNFTDLKFTSGVNVSQVSGKAQVSVAGGAGTALLYGFLKQRITNGAAATKALTYADCGSSVSNDATARFTLPSISADSTMVGCRFTFISGVGGTAPITIAPYAGEQIVILTNKQGDAISTDTFGNSVVLESLGNLYWAPVGKEQGTFNDVN